MKLLLLLALTGCAVAFIDPDLSKLTGRWFMLYSKPLETDLEADWLPIDALCPNIEYKALNDTSLKGFAAFRLRTYNGSIVQETAIYHKTDKEGVLKFEAPGYPTLINYVLYTGPEVDGLYQYYIFAGPSEHDARVIVRDVKQFKEKYADEVEEWLESNDLEVREIVENENCQYVWPDF